MCLSAKRTCLPAHAAAPTWFVRQMIEHTYRSMRPIRYIGPGRYCLSVNNCTLYREVEDFDHLCWIVAYYIGSRFGGLSNEALGYRIAQVGFVVDATAPGLRLNRVARTPSRVSQPLPALAVAGSHF